MTSAPPPARETPPAPPRPRWSWFAFVLGFFGLWAVLPFLFLAFGSIAKERVLAGGLLAMVLIGIVLGLRGRTWSCLAGTVAGVALVVAGALVKQLR